MKDTAKVRAWDFGEKQLDRFTVDLGLAPGRPGFRRGLFMSERPTHPQGFCQHGEFMPGRHLGKRIPFDSLPEECRCVALRDLNE